MMPGPQTPIPRSLHAHQQRSPSRELCIARQWSQEQLASLSGLNLRTIQRLESGAKVSTESLRALAAASDVSAESLLASNPAPSRAATDTMREGLQRGLDFTGTTTRADFWWFALAVAMVLAFAQLIREAADPLSLQIASLVVLLPWLAACTPRLRNAGLNPWWQLISLAPVASWSCFICSPIRPKQHERQKQRQDKQHAATNLWRHRSQHQPSGTASSCERGCMPFPLQQEQRQCQRRPDAQRQQRQPGVPYSKPPPLNNHEHRHRDAANKHIGPGECRNWRSHRVLHEKRDIQSVGRYPGQELRQRQSGTADAENDVDDAHDLLQSIRHGESRHQPRALPLRCARMVGRKRHSLQHARLLTRTTRCRTRTGERQYSVSDRNDHYCSRLHQPVASNSRQKKKPRFPGAFFGNGVPTGIRTPVATVKG